MSTTLSRHYAEDLRYIQQPELWVAWPYCPVKRFSADGRSRDFGYIRAVEGELTTIRHGNMFAASSDDPKTVYETPEALLADGWEPLGQYHWMTCFQI